MTLTSDECYQALVAHDARFDGVFFVGVSTTGIYCRPVCRAKTPRRTSCTFYANAAAAEEAGFRPCLRCRPELAPGRARCDAMDTLARRAASRIEDGALNEQSVAELAQGLGSSERHLRRSVEKTFGVSPVALAQTHRLLLAKRLLTDTELPVTEIAFASGFSSLRRFNALFVERYRLNPSGLRRRVGAAYPATLECLLPARAPLESAALLRFLGARAIPGVEQVEDGIYRRTLRVGKHMGWLTASFVEGKDTLRVEVSASLAPALGQVLARVKRLFDLDADPGSIVGTLSADSYLKPLVEQAPGLRLPGSMDGFEQAVRAVLGQQVSVAAARTLAGRIVETFGEPIETPYPTLNHLFPTPLRIAELDEAAFSGLGITGARIRTLRRLAELVATKALVLKPGVDVEKTIETLLTIPGIGPWTAQYIALRALHWPDAFPNGDLGLLHALNETDAKLLQERAECWRPWRGYAVMHLWHSLETK